MGLFDFWRQRSVGSAESTSGGLISADTYLPEIEITSSADGKYTSIEGREFALHLAFRWERVPSESSLEFRNQNLPEQLIITARQTRERLSERDRSLVLSKIVDVHQDALRKLLEGSVQISTPEQVHKGAESEARFYAKGKSMTMALGVRYIPDRIYTFAMYRYTDVDLGMPFGIYAGTMLDLLKLKPCTA